MTLRSVALEAVPSRGLGVLAACWELGKPRMITMILVTTVAGFYLGSPSVMDFRILVHLMAGTALSAAGALALNQLLERDSDALMERTRTRPLPGGRIAPLEALAFGAGTTIAGLLWLGLAVNGLSALVTACVVAVYLFAYTPLKRRTALCTVVGAFPGALPPVAGWAAATGEITLGAAILFGIMFFWQLPHSLAIAWIYRADYARAGIRLLPTVEPTGRSTGRHILANSLALLAVGLLPTLSGMAGWPYFITALAMGAFLLGAAARSALRRSDAAARLLLRTSLVYVPVVLVAMILDKAPL